MSSQTEMVDSLTAFDEEIGRIKVEVIIYWLHYYLFVEQLTIPQTDLKFRKELKLDWLRVTNYMGVHPELVAVTSGFTEDSDVDMVVFEIKTLPDLVEKLPFVRAGRSNGKEKEQNLH